MTLFEDLPASVLIEILLQLDLKDLCRCLEILQDSKSGLPRVTEAIYTILYHKVSLVTAETLDDNSKWADECLECDNYEGNGIVFKNMFSNKKRIYGMVLLNQLSHLFKYYEHVTSLCISCVDISSLYLFGTTHHPDKCLKLFGFQESVKESLAGEASLLTKTKGLHQEKNPSTKCHINGHTNGHAFAEIAPPIQETATLRRFQQFIISLPHLNKIEVLCPCLLPLVKSTAISNRIVLERADPVKPSFVMYLSDESLGRSPLL